MDFRTPVMLPHEAPAVTPACRAIVVGSCFAEHVGARLRTTLGAQQCCVNPFGVLYNPTSIAQGLQLILTDSTTARRSVEANVFCGRDGLHHSWLHSTHYSAPTREECVKRCLDALDEARERMDEADLLIVTFGTSRSYMLQDDEAGRRVVANCHKELASRFAETDSTVDDIVGIWRPLLAALHQRRPELKVVFTVSPYRYRKYGYHASQLSKARLLLAIEALTHDADTPDAGTADRRPPTQQTTQRTPERLFYFPAYELLLDELRDYRFYAADMLHPSEQAVDYIWERFCEWAFTPETLSLQQQRIRQLKALNHHAHY